MTHYSIDKDLKTQPTFREENRKYIFWILFIILLFNLFYVVIFLIGDVSFKQLLSADSIIFNFSLLFIPLTVVNLIYILKLGFTKYCKTQFQFLLLKISGLVLGVIIGTGVIEFISYLAGVIDDDYIAIGSFQMSTVTTNFVSNVFFGLVIGYPVFMRQDNQAKMQVKLIEKERELDKVYQLKVKSELDAIHAKINPHFLYNSLNSIVSLIHENPDKAEKMVLSLSDLFRYSINSKNQDFATIKEEIDLVSTYLDIEYVRFQDQLEFEIIAEEHVKQIKIPKFLIQPLIENAIKHGTSKVKSGIIKLEIKLEKEDLIISVFDNGPNFPEEIDSGWGLKSTRDKLDLLYKNDYSFQVLNVPKKLVLIKLKKIFVNDRKEARSHY